LLHSMPPKPANPTAKDLEEAIQATEQRLENAITANHHHFTEQIGMMNTKLDHHQQHLDDRDAELHRSLDERLEALTTLFTAAISNRPPEPPPLPSSGIPTSSTIPQFTVIQPVFSSETSPHTNINTTLPIPSTPLPKSSSTTTVTHPLWPQLTQTQPLFTSTQIPVTLPTPLMYSPQPQPYVQTPQYRQPSYTPTSNLTTAIPFGTFHHTPPPYGQTQQNPYFTPSPSQ
jgi:hypothetical protein